jgi:hypothetical protein
MKFRMIVLILIVTLAAWLPAVAQQAPPQDPGKTAAKPACACCAQTDQHGKDAASGQSAMACCHGKDSKDMACCTKAAKDNKDATQAMPCCNGKDSKDAKMCASKDGKPCCDSKNGMSCCGKDATTACNSKDGKDCCSAHANGK